MVQQHQVHALLSSGHLQSVSLAAEYNFEDSLNVCCEGMRMHLDGLLL